MSAPRPRRLLAGGAVILALLVPILADSPAPVGAQQGTADTGSQASTNVTTGAQAGDAGAGDARAGDADADADADDPSLALLEQTPWVSAGGVFAVRVGVAHPPEDAYLEASLFPAVVDPTDVDRTAAGDNLDRPLEVLPAVPIPSGTDAAVVRLPVGRSEADASRLDLEPGVYPLAVDLFDRNGEQRARLVTHVVVDDPATAKQRPVAVVAHLDQPFRLDAAGRLQLVGGNDGLAAAIDRLHDASAVPFTLVATPGSLTAVSASGGATDSDGDAAQRARTAAALEDLAGHVQVVNVPFASLPGGAWVSASLDQAIIDQLDGGVSALSAAFGGPPTGTVWLVGPTDNPLLLRWLAARGVETFLVPTEGNGTVAPSNRDAPTSGDTNAPTTGDAGAGGGGDEVAAQGPPPAPFRLAQVETPHLTLAAEHVGPQAGRSPDERPSPVADAYRLLARLSVPTLTPSDDRSADPDASPVADPAVLLLDDFSPAALPFVTTLLGGLGQEGPLTPVTIDGLRLAIAQGEPGAGESGAGRLDAWELPEHPSIDLAELAAELGAAGGAIDSFVTTAGAGDPAVVPLRLAVLTMGSQDLSGGERHDLRVHVESTVQNALAGVDLGDDQPVTVTAHRTDLPLTVHNGGSRTLAVAVAVDSSDLELTGDTTQTLQLTPGATVDLNVPIEISRSGDFRLRVRVTSADGRIQLAERVVTVRSTAISGVGVVLSLGALLFLFAWWGRHILRTRRGRRNRADGGHDRAATATAASAATDTTPVTTTTAGTPSASTPTTGDPAAGTPAPSTSIASTATADDRAANLPSGSTAVQHRPIDEPVP